MPPELCPDCGQPLPIGAPDGMCPNCLLKLAIAAGGTPNPESIKGELRRAPLTLHPEQPGSRVGHYKLLEPIGEGGFGTVWSAEQQEPVRRRVALKIIKLGMDTREVVTRFEAERQALALMDHPSIARVFDAGATEAGRPYFVMELVQGMRITDYCDARRLGLDQRLKLFIAVCQAVQHAHQKGVIHRDLKPSNVLVTEQDGSPLPKVIDFGIAKATEQKLTDETMFTRFNQVMGTPAYMSPEQAGLGRLDIDTRSDVYSLGVLLYELLTGRTPFDHGQLREAGCEAVLKMIRETEPPRPSTRLSALSAEELKEVAGRRGELVAQLSHRLRGDLDWVLLKALEKDRGRRYETPNDLASDLRRVLSHEPITAAPPSLGYQFTKFARRNRGVIFTATGFAVVLLAGIVVSTWQAVRATRHAEAELKHRRAAETAQGEAEKQRTAALDARAEAEHHLGSARKNLYFADMNLVGQALGASNLERVHDILDRYVPLPGEPDLRGWEWYFFKHEARDQSTFSFPPQPHIIRSLAFSADGRTLMSVGHDGTSSFWDWDSRQLRDRTTNGVYRASISGDGRYFATADLLPTNRVKVFDWYSRAVLAAAEVAEGVNDLAFSPDATSLASSSFASTNHSVMTYAIWNPTNAALIHEWSVRNRGSAHNGKLAYSPDGKRIAISSFPGALRIMNLSSGLMEHEVSVNDEYLSALAWAPNGRWLATGSALHDTLVRIFQVDRDYRMTTLRGHSSWVSSLVVSTNSNSRWLVSGSADQTACIWDMRDATLARTLRGHRHEIWAMALSPDQKFLVTGSKGGEIKVWNFPTEQAGPSSPVALPSMDSLQVDRSNQVFVGIEQKSNVLFGRTREPERLLWIRRLGTNMSISKSRLAISADGTLFARSHLGELRLFFTGESRCVTNLTASGAPISLLKFVDRDRRLVAISESGTVRTFSLELQQLTSWSTRRNGIVSTAPEVFICSLGSGETGIFSLATGDQVARLNLRLGAGPSTATSPDGRLLALADENGNVYLLDPATWTLKGNLRGHMHAVNSVTFSPDGRRLVTGGGSRGSIKIWDLETLQEVCTLPVVSPACHMLNFSPDSHTLAIGMGPGNITILQAPGFRWEGGIDRRRSK